MIGGELMFMLVLMVLNCNCKDCFGVFKGGDWDFIYMNVFEY